MTRSVTVSTSLVSLSPESGLSVKIPPGYRGAMLPIEPEMICLTTSP